MKNIVNKKILAWINMELQKGNRIQLEYRKNRDELACCIVKTKRVKVGTDTKTL